YLLFHARDELVGPEEERSEDASRTRTLGVRWSASAGAVDWRVEAAYQSGEIRFRTTDPVGWTDYDDVGAYLMAARFGVRPVDALSVSLWYDRLSGDDDPGDDEYGVFDTLFATNHKFYGYMDLFLDIPRHTARRGLQDGAVKLSYVLGPHGTLGAALHGFRVASAWGLSSGRIGEELDLSYRWSQVDGVSVAAGLSYFLAGAAWSDPAGLGRGDDDQLWGHVMLDVTF
ncbi:MAG: hypothetical protein GWM90_03460, partial [Gemmatimonadetes bacterium]|nr:hypothetical protein [Gemmatimonadota bacterium]NIQ52702.1 hypothetical protein [Gemmatimonadota bacterium]NIU72839.1 hypothetical protein [Gammaproteobacteria bacterium]NIX43209.1 hypothetical protein [Gemmatimonadota bacterium]NIY07381.1 hypothetical protein [Gemmatimonadota bacterium]